MIDRRLQDTIATRLSAKAAVGLLGPRQVGKTTLARALVAKAKRGWDPPLSTSCGRLSRSPDA